VPAVFLHMKRVARDKVLARLTVNERFVDSVGENERIKARRDQCNNDISADDLNSCRSI
jgi:hypothetical protein